MAWGPDFFPNECSLKHDNKSKATYAIKNRPIMHFSINVNILGVTKDIWPTIKAQIKILS